MNFKKEIKEMSCDELELDIKKLYKTYTKNKSESVRLRIKNQLKQRKRLINERIIFTPDIVNYIMKVNQLLTDKTMLIIKKAVELNQQMEEVKKAGDNFLEDYEVEYSIKIEYDGENLRNIEAHQNYIQSDYYAIADILYDLDLSGMETYVIDSSQLENWNHEFPLSVPELSDIKFCYASHELFCHGHYSILDIIRINLFWTEVYVRWQNFGRINN